MKVEHGKLVTLEYTITTEKGELIESSAGRGEPLKFVFGTDSGMLPGMNPQIEGMAMGEEKSFNLQPEEAFGPANEGPTMPIPQSSFPEGVELKVGASFQGELPGTNQTVKFIIQEHTTDGAVVKLIHPLAGKVINVKVKLIDIADA